MSINDKIHTLAIEGRLIELRPFGASDIQRRSMYLEVNLFNKIVMHRQSETDKQRFESLEADLQTFLISPNIDPAYLFGLTPRGKGVWEIRSVRPRPSLRVFGCFARKDTFVATHMATRVRLGDRSTLEWKRQISMARKIWQDLLPNYRPLIGEAKDLITGALDEKYYRDQNR